MEYGFTSSAPNRVGQAIGMKRPTRLRQDPPVTAAGYVSTRRGIFSAREIRIEVVTRHNVRLLYEQRADFYFIENSFDFPIK